MRNIEEDFERFVSIFDELVPEASGGKAEKGIWGVSLELRGNECPKIFLVVHRDGEEFGDEAMWGGGSAARTSLEDSAKFAAQFARIWLKGPNA